MSEALLRRLAQWLPDVPVVLASVAATRGATPRKAGSRMLIGVSECAFSVGGGEAEARTIEAARALLADGGRCAELLVDLDGRPGAAGVCGGRMRIALRRWAGASDLDRARELAARIAAGQPVQLLAEDVGDAAAATRVEPDERLLIVGAGHCGLALYELAAALDFELCVFDERSELACPERFPAARCWSGDYAELRHALDTPRRVLAVLLSRDFRSDVAALRQLALAQPAFVGMMGSRRRIKEVRAALADTALDFDAIRAPVGLDLGAQTPHEIAVSILAELVAFRHAAIGWGERSEPQRRRRRTPRC